MTGETMVHEVYTLRRGGSALVVSMPHCGTGLFDGLEARLTPEALDLADTDWHIPELYDFAAEFDATIIAARLSRYVVDLNRPSSGESRVRLARLRRPRSSEIGPRSSEIGPRGRGRRPSREGRSRARRGCCRRQQGVKK